MSRREQREQIFKILFGVEFHSAEELDEQIALYMEELGEIRQKEADYILNKVHSIVEHLDDVLAEFDRIIGLERLTGRVQRGVYPLGARQLEEFCQEVHLPQRLAAADGDAALFAPVIAVAPDVLEQLLRRPFRAALSAPRFGVVAVFAA